MFFIFLIKLVDCMIEFFPDEDRIQKAGTDEREIQEDTLSALESTFEEDEEGTHEGAQVELKSPKNAWRSIRYGKIMTNPENLETLIHNEMHDISPDMHYRISKKLATNTVDRNKFRDLFLIKKRVIQDGKKKIISFNIKEKIIPKVSTLDQMNKDFGLRAILAGILFLLAGLVFTTTMKMYQNIFRKKYLAFEKKLEGEREGDLIRNSAHS
ncbi:hypothetical protein NGRA_2985 [Nosema granulosis]|uniref:Uncharacterized protein n=1 Tax=Nosema granulosis TaxID=83296 RepID=A0A9P6GVK3_9MICR|nr:hypothetical protein NGRA_2985 [Nosema granulosis]